MRSWKFYTIRTSVFIVYARCAEDRRGYFRMLFKRQSDEAEKWQSAGGGRGAVSKDRMLTLASREACRRNF